MPARASQPLAIACLLPLSAALAAQPAPDTPNAEACRAIESGALRLACYDAAHAPDPTEEATALRVDTETIVDEAKVESATTLATDGSLRERARRRLGAVFRFDDGSDDRVLDSGQGSLLDSRWELAPESKLGAFQMRAYKPVYLLPAFLTSDANQTPTSANPDNVVSTSQNLDDVETKFQISFKTKFVENLLGDNGDLWGAYTQNSRWQVYNSEESRPFRETNYEPAVMLVFRNNYRLGGWQGHMAAISLNHQSNGREDPFSRSWNRIILSAGLDRENWAFVVRPWWRIPDGSDDDNPDIEEFVGRGDASLIFSRGGHEVALLGRHSLRGGDQSRGAIQLDWGFPIDGTLRGRVQIFHGYGESLIDYNHKATYVGLGISLLEWF